jgi:hypothetical protein
VHRYWLGLTLLGVLLAAPAANAALFPRSTGAMCTTQPDCIPTVDDGLRFFGDKRGYPQRGPTGSNSLSLRVNGGDPRAPWPIDEHWTYVHPYIFSDRAQADEGLAASVTYTADVDLTARLLFRVFSLRGRFTDPKPITGGITVGDAVVEAFAYTRVPPQHPPYPGMYGPGPYLGDIVEFEAKAGEDITFWVTAEPGGGYGGIEVKTTPVPPAAVLLAPALAGMMWLRRRRRAAG